MSTCASVGPFSGSLRIAGSVRQDGDPAPCFVRLLDRGGEFVAEVRTDSAGKFSFYTIPGEWTLRAISRRGTIDSAVVLVDADLIDVAMSI